ncbi:hypothetical protein CK223_28705 [Mesorhizobium loti]|nr:hypothetical protein CK223_28705 [Mesorhizobium loti]
MSWISFRANGLVEFRLATPLRGQLQWRWQTSHPPALPVMRSLTQFPKLVEHGDVEPVGAICHAPAPLRTRGRDSTGAINQRCCVTQLLYHAL